MMNRAGGFGRPRQWPRDSTGQGRFRIMPYMESTAKSVRNAPQIHLPRPYKAGKADEKVMTPYLVDLVVA
jgi:hypothetical protein